MQAEDNLLKAFHEWQATFDAMSDAIWILDRNHRILRSNKTAVQLYKCSEKELIGKPCWEIVHGSELPIPGCAVLRAKASLQRESMELTINGRCYRVTVDHILDKNGEYDKAVHIITDIDEYKKAQAGKRKSEEKFRALFEACGDGILVAELDTKKFIEANPSICKMLGYSKDELLLKTVKDIHPPESLDLVLKEFKAQAEGKKLVAPNIPCYTKQKSNLKRSVPSPVVSLTILTICLG